MAISSAADAAQASTQAGTQPLVQPLPNVKFSGPGAGIYLQKQNEAEFAYKQAQADLLQKRNSAYHQYGLNAQGAVDPNAQYGGYQALLSQQENQLHAADEDAQQRGLGASGLAMQQERRLRYTQGVENLGFQQQVGDIASGYSAGSQAALLARNQAILDAQLSSLQTQGLSGGGGGGVSAGGGGYGGAAGTAGQGDLQDFLYDAKVPGGYSIEGIYQDALKNAPAGQYPGHVMNQGGIIMQNGVPGVMIKYFDNPQGTGSGNTIWVPLSSSSAAAAQASQSTDTSTTTKPPTQTAIKALVKRLGNTNTYINTKTGIRME